MFPSPPRRPWRPSAFRGRDRPPDAAADEEGEGKRKPVQTVEAPGKRQESTQPQQQQHQGPPHHHHQQQQQAAAADEEDGDYEGLELPDAAELFASMDRLQAAQVQQQGAVAAIEDGPMENDSQDDEASQAPADDAEEQEEESEGESGDDDNGEGDDTELPEPTGVAASSSTRRDSKKENLWHPGMPSIGEDRELREEEDSEPEEAEWESEEAESSGGEEEGDELDQLSVASNFGDEQKLERDIDDSGDDDNDIDDDDGDDDDEEQDSHQEASPGPTAQQQETEQQQQEVATSATQDQHQSATQESLPASPTAKPKAKQQAQPAHQQDGSHDHSQPEGEEQDDATAAQRAAVERTEREGIDEEPPEDIWVDDHQRQHDPTVHSHPQWFSGCHGDDEQQRPDDGAELAAEGDVRPEGDSEAPEIAEVAPQQQEQQDQQDQDVHVPQSLEWTPGAVIATRTITKTIGYRVVALVPSPSRSPTILRQSWLTQPSLPLPTMTPPAAHHRRPTLKSSCR
ncbi:unnamed protein product [Vitrella brassicaformis CCMP3155]|uniref:Uncharacterized protein n=1 Tax=Vitrella brassicaformis (strain CCMP3155) TaxID=1169540 RepID=A0A0G4EQM2_VITBC|nr:unnamed protein product [Vitrella brassicaformis CCMP3155]|eukprot:CEL99735.1 unnamed protein product [Vitrella brassicaformis CCMP3155]